MFTEKVRSLFPFATGFISQRRAYQKALTPLMIKHSASLLSQPQKRTLTTKTLSKELVRNREMVRGISTSIQKYAEPSAASTQGQPAPSRIEKTVNQITLMGRVGADPQKRGTPEHPVVVFSLATHANYNYQDGGMLQKTDWHRVCVFKPYLRENVYKYMSKGQRVYVTGRISYGEIKDDQGSTHVATSIIAEDVIFITDSASRNRSTEDT